MMVRKATANDVPAIVALLKISLGESLMPKSEAFWKWKHIDNPFGESPVLLAVENNEIVGVRAFMRWEWKVGDRILKAVRAVDTATHPEHQGKGIFKKLTLSLVDECKQEGIDFIFNTPNKQSSPGYKKMGWSSLGKLPVYINPVVPFLSSVATVQPHDDLSFLAAPQTEMLLQMVSGIILSTYYSAAYLHWRYAENPNLQYKAIVSYENERYLIIYRVKKTRIGNELRIVEAFFDPVHRLRIRNKILSISKLENARIISMRPRTTHPFILHTPLSVGPEVTIKNLNCQDFDQLLNFKQWAPSLGDLEVF